MVAAIGQLNYWEENIYTIYKYLLYQLINQAHQSTYRNTKTIPEDTDTYNQCTEILFNVKFSAMHRIVKGNL